VPCSYRCPAQIDHKTLQPFGGFGCSLEAWKIELFKDSVSGDALDAIVTDLASDLSQSVGPRVRWFDG
jgi:hypothetical protein